MNRILIHIDGTPEELILFCKENRVKSASKLKQNAGSWQTGKRFSSAAVKPEAEDRVNSPKQKNTILYSRKLSISISAFLC